MLPTLYPPEWLNETVTVYGLDAAGAFTVALQAGLKVRLSRPNVRPGAAGPDRQELAATRRLFWPADVALPESFTAVDSAGQRWNAVPGTGDRPRTPEGTVLWNLCDVVEAASG